MGKGKHKHAGEDEDAGRHESDEDFLAHFLVDPQRPFRLAEHDPAWLSDGGLEELALDELKSRAKKALAKSVARLAEAQELLWADDRHALLVLLQGMDTAGKDGTIEHVMSGVNPQGCEVHGFKQPTPEELDHDYLWRYARRCPERGRIGIFNRTWYEDVLVVKVHPQVLARQRIPPGPRGAEFWQARYETINAFERHLTNEGTRVVKVFLNLSKAEQKRRLLARLDTPEKRWKFSPGDVEERAFWSDYQRAYEDAIRATSTPWAPWWIVPADHKFFARYVVAEIVCRAIHGLELTPPVVPPEREPLLAEARGKLLAEG